MIRLSRTFVLVVPLVVTWVVFVIVIVMLCFYSVCSFVFGRFVRSVSFDLGLVCWFVPLNTRLVPRF